MTSEVVFFIFGVEVEFGWLRLLILALMVLFLGKFELVRSGDFLVESVALNDVLGSVLDLVVMSVVEFSNEASDCLELDAVVELSFLTFGLGGEN